MNQRDPVGLTAVAFVAESPDHFALGVRSLLDRADDVEVVVGVLYPIYAAEFEALGPRVLVRPVGSIAQLIDETYAQRRTHIVVLHDVAILPPDPFATALRWLRDDVRIATVSFLSNAADYLSFPNRNSPIGRPPDGHDEATVTRRLREMTPAAAPAPVMYATGPAVILSASALGAVGNLFAPASARFDVAVADFSARARGKGFVDVVDTSTFVWRPSDVAVHPLDDTLTFDDRGWLLHRHPSMVGFIDEERTSLESAFAIAHHVARVKVRGLRIVVDGGCFGPLQVGTQVATEHTIRALAAHPDVAEVAVVVPGPVPEYAVETLTGKKVRALTVPGNDLRACQPDITDVDIVFRPFQPTQGWDASMWRQIGRRFVISVLDTIAFHNGGYFGSSGEWLDYRENLRSCVRVADAVTVISDDVITQMRMHAFPIPDARLHSVPLGTEHLDGAGATSLPAELLARGFSAGAFALCLGVNYTHKNREIALAAHELVLAAGHELALVFAGASVPHGSTRLAEARHGSREHVFVLPELATAEKNWLLRHASLVWYPTSAEGFGLVPFEAAAYGTPTVAVDFGPLHELLIGDSGRARSYGIDVPLLASDWTPAALADVACRFLDDPDLARRHCDAVREAGALYSWERTASSLVGLFRDVLAMPRR